MHASKIDRKMCACVVMDIGRAVIFPSFFYWKIDPYVSFMYHSLRIRPVFISLWKYMFYMYVIIKLQIAQAPISSCMVAIWVFTGYSSSALNFPNVINLVNSCTTGRLASSVWPWSSEGVENEETFLWLFISFWWCRNPAFYYHSQNLD